MRVDFSLPLIGFTGQQLADGDAPLTLRMVACNAVTAVIPGETLTGVQKCERVELATRIFGAKEPLELTIEEVAEVRRLINAVFLSPVIVAAAWKALDPK